MDLSFLGVNEKRFDSDLLNILRRSLEYQLDGRTEITKQAGTLPGVM
jgi:hypothetical protein